MNQVMTDAQMWALIVGFLSPIVIAVVQRPTYGNQVRVLIMVAWSGISGTGTAWLAGEFTGRGITSCVLLVVISAISSYQSIWKPLRVAPVIEAKTSGKRARVTEQVVTEPVVVEGTGGEVSRGTSPRLPRGKDVSGGSTNVRGG